MRIYIIICTEIPSLLNYFLSFLPHAYSLNVPPTVVPIRTVEPVLKDHILIIEIWFVKTDGLWWYVQFNWNNISPFVRKVWFVKTGAISGFLTETLSLYCYVYLATAVGADAGWTSGPFPQSCRTRQPRSWQGQHWRSRSAEARQDRGDLSLQPIIWKGRQRGVLVLTGQV